MTTRSFIKSLIVSAVAPSILLPVLGDRQRWKKSKGGGMWVLGSLDCGGERRIVYLTDVDGRVWISGNRSSWRGEFIPTWKAEAFWKEYFSSRENRITPNSRTALAEDIHAFCKLIDTTV